MAEGAGIQLWDYEEWELISQVKVLDSHLDDKTPVILDKISFNPNFWALVIKNNVMDKNARDEIQVKL